MSKPIVAYLVSEYPAISHTFVFREVESLRAQGFIVKTASILRPGNLHRMTPEEQADAEQTFYMKEAGIGKIAAAHLHLALTRPGVYLRMLGRWVRLAWRAPVRLEKLAAHFGGAGLLLDWMHRNQVGHVHVHLANPAATMAMLAAAGGTVSFSMSVHGPDVFYNVETNFLPEKVRAAAFVRCISFFCQSQLMRLVPFVHWPKLHIVRCGVDVDRFAPRPEPANDTPEILCLGRLVPAKGQRVLLEAARLLRQRGRRFHVTFVGDGPDRQSLEDLCNEWELNDTVEFTGAVGHDEVHAFYDRADVFVLPSFAEGLPVVLMEAMAKEIPCVSTRIAAMSELIEDGANGLLLPPSDVAGLADSLERLLDHPERRRALGGEARRKVLTEYDAKVNSSGMAELFRGVGAAAPQDAPEGESTSPSAS